MPAGRTHTVIAFVPAGFMVVGWVLWMSGRVDVVFFEATYLLSLLSIPVAGVMWLGLLLRALVKPERKLRDVVGPLAGWVTTLLVGIATLVVFTVLLTAG